jgi:hypothetical protein
VFDGLLAEDWAAKRVEEGEYGYAVKVSFILSQWKAYVFYAD